MPDRIRPVQDEALMARCPQVAIMFCLITATRPKNDMSSGARGGVGGTMGRRTLAIFMALSRRCDAGK
jgi:hypothetical protein